MGPFLYADLSQKNSSSAYNPAWELNRFTTRALILLQLFSRKTSKMRPLFVLATLWLTLFPTGATAQDVPQVKYRHWGMTGGYRDKVTGPNEWRVVAGTNGRAPDGSAGRIALYRAAELTKSAGFKYFQIINQKVSQMYLGVGWSAPTIRGPGGAEMNIIAVNDPTPPQTCLAKQPELCATLDAEETMQKIAPYLIFSEDK